MIATQIQPAVMRPDVRDAGRPNLIRMRDPQSPEQVRIDFAILTGAVFSPLTAVDMDHHSLAVDIRDFQVQTFVKAQTAGIDSTG